ncbi:MAG: SDR family NAD(P)-dependent oxidoreductase, partial [Alphaproteobacteria bacterium]
AGTRMKKLLLEGRVAVVTGGARGIGRAIAETFVREGAKVVVADNGTSIGGDGADPHVAAEAAKALGANAVAFPDSVASPGAALALVELAQRRWGGIDIVINNAAIIRDAFVFKGDPRDWDAVIHNNLNAAYYLINAATPVMREQAKNGRPRAGEGYHWGRIVNVGSTAGFYGNFGQAAYGAAKAGMFALTRITAMEMARSAVTANFVIPFARTRVTDSIKPANDAQAAYKARAVKISPQSVADLMLALCCDLGRKVSGQLLGVRGRELFLFSQPRPAVRLPLPADEWSPARIGAVFGTEMAPLLTDLTTDLEHFNTEPLV